MRHKPRAAAAALAALALGASLPTPASAQSLAQELRGAQSAAASLRERIDAAETSFLRPEAVSDPYSLAQALEDARQWHAGGDWESVAVLLNEFVSEAVRLDNPAMEEAAYLLADAFYQQRNYLLARRHFDRLADSARYGAVATQRRLEIAIALRHDDRIAELSRELERYVGRGGGADEVAYTQGKALFVRDQFEAAINALGSVDSASAFFERAQYVAAVCRVKLGDLANARTTFEAIAARLANAGDPDAVALRELSQLAVGRLHYEEGRWLDAIEAYTLVPRGSSNYPPALYELAWTQIQQGDATAEGDPLRNQYYQTALTNLQIVTLVAPSTSRAAVEAQLVRGDLMMRIAEYDGAVAEFTAVSDAYFPVEVELREIARRHRDPSQFFDALVNAETGGLRIPTLAEPWVRNDPALERALNALRVLQSSREDIRAGYELLSQIDAVLNTGARINAFPRSREGWTQVIQIQAEVSRQAGRVVAAAARGARGRMDSSAAAAYDQIRQRVAAREAEIESLPATTLDVDARVESVQAGYAAQLLDIHRAEMALRAQSRNLEALRQMYLNGETRTQEDPQVVNARFADEEQRIRSQRDALRAQHEVIRARQVSVAVGDQVHASESGGRTRYLEALAEEADFLARNGTGGQNDIAAVQRVLAELQAVDRDCVEFFNSMERTLVEQSAELRDRAARERAVLEQAEARLPQLEAETESTAGAVALDAFTRVHERFTGITLRANLGVLDVAWHQKELLTDQIERLFEERNQSLRELDADFAELLEGN